MRAGREGHMGKLVLAMTGFTLGVAVAVALSARRELNQPSGTALSARAPTANA